MKNTKRWKLVTNFPNLLEYYWDNKSLISISRIAETNCWLTASLNGSIPKELNEETTIESVAKKLNVF